MRPGLCTDAFEKSPVDFLLSLFSLLGLLILFGSLLQIFIRCSQRVLPFGLNGK